MSKKKKPGEFEPGDLVALKVEFCKIRENAPLKGKVATVIESIAQNDKGELYYRLKWGDSALDLIAPNVGGKALKHVAGDPEGRRRIPVAGEGDLVIEYDSNNSGGGWWLDDDDWEKLEAGGWQVDWYSDPEVQSGFLSPSSDGRWLGALATKARKRFEKMGDGICEWERLTGKSSTSVGCSCCGVPHSFRSENINTGESNYWSTRRDDHGSSYDEDEDD